MTKRLFQVLDEMNVNDENNKTRHCRVSNHLVSANLAKGGGHVTIGVEAEAIHELATNNDIRCVLLVVDFKEYERLTKLNTNATDQPPMEG